MGGAALAAAREPSYAREREAVPSVVARALPLANVLDRHSRVGPDPLGLPGCPGQALDQVPSPRESAG
eukprot:5610052-Alexandrium_andersonii.AAC.1